MTSRSSTSPRANVIQLSKFIDDDKSVASRLARDMRSGVSSNKTGMAAKRCGKLLSMRQRLNCHGSLEIHGHGAVRVRLSGSERDRIVAEVRALLHTEFGHLRVYRSRDAFIIRHHDRKEMIAGILRVQYHARQIGLAAQHETDEAARGNRVLLNWGVGTSMLEADSERLRRRNRRLSRE